MIALRPIRPSTSANQRSEIKNQICVRSLSIHAISHRVPNGGIAEQHLALARERLALERAKFEFNAAREALNHHATLGKIMADTNRDDEDKIQAAREMIFGKEVIAQVDANDPLRRQSP